MQTFHNFYSHFNSITFSLNTIDTVYRSTSVKKFLWFIATSIKWTFYKIYDCNIKILYFVHIFPASEKRSSRSPLIYSVTKSHTFLPFTVVLATLSDRPVVNYPMPVSVCELSIKESEKGKRNRLLPEQLLSVLQADSVSKKRPV